VSYGYGDTPLFAGLSVRIAANERVAFIGPSGAGKSTLLGLITGTHEPRAGSVTIDGKPPRDVDVRVAYVPQETALLRGTIADNVALAIDGASDLDNAAVRAALTVAALDDASELGRGANTVVGEGAPGCRAGSGSGWRSLVPLRTPRRCSFSTRRPPPSTETPRAR